MQTFPKYNTLHTCDKIKVKGLQYMFEATKSSILKFTLS